MQKQDAPWFESWFDSPYYHILYSNRNHNEAALFINKLIELLQLNKTHILLDLACGKGRHALELSKSGAQTYGVDLSPGSISYAKKFETANLHFDIHDMRDVYKPLYFTHVFNLFTSFGYFDNIDDNYKMLQSIYSMLSDNGIFVIDFFNSTKVIQTLIPNEIKHIQGIEFHIIKTIQSGYIIKYISFTDRQQTFNYQEKVQLFTAEQLQGMLHFCNFEILYTFGSYALDKYDAEQSDRLLYIVRKKQP